MAGGQVDQGGGAAWGALVERVRRIEQQRWSGAEQDAGAGAGRGGGGAAGSVDSGPARLGSGWWIDPSATEASASAAPALGEGSGGTRQIGLRRGALHEWFLMEPAASGEGDAADGAAAPSGDDESVGRSADGRRERGGASRRGARWGWPPLCVLGHLAGRALAEHGGQLGHAGHLRGELAAGAPRGHAAHEVRGSPDEVGWVVWIGRWCWPHGRLLWRASEAGAGIGPGLLQRSLFVDPPDDAARLWAIDVSLRSGAVAAVMADGRGLDMAATRRIQLAARAGGTGAAGGCGGALALLARPPSERGGLSAAVSRWSVTPTPAPGDRPRWRVELLRCKDAAAHATGGALISPRVGQRFIVEWNHATGLVAVPAELADRSGQAAPATRIAGVSRGDVRPHRPPLAPSRRTA